MADITATQISAVRKVAEAAWRQHFRIPEGAYWATLIASVVFAGVTPAGGVLFALSVVGIARWHWHRSKSRALVITRFSTVRGDEGMAVRVQDLIMTSLQDKLPPGLLDLVHPVPAVVGEVNKNFSARLRRRLRAIYLLHGRIDRTTGGGTAVFARIVQPSDRGVWHYDWFTRDRTPARARWSALVELLTPTKEVIAEQYPLEFTGELEAIVRGTAGQVAVAFEDYQPAEELLRAALARAPDSTSHQIDQLRLALARALVATDRRDEALSLLRERARGADPSPALLRELHHLLGPQPRDPSSEWSDEARREAIAALRRALEYENDPQRDLTLYNLAMTLGEEETDEAIRILEELMDRSSFYRRTWYLPYRLGGIRWGQALEAEGGGHEQEARRRFSEAAKYYSRGIRRRPKLKLFMQDGRTLYVWRRFDPSPQMHGNARDAHARAGHRVRSRWHEWRFQWTRMRMLRRADDGMRHPDWDKAYAYYDWAVVGRWDHLEATARTLRAIASQQRGHLTAASQDWEETRQREPALALTARSLIVRDLGNRLPAGVPGDEPTDLDAVREWLRERGYEVPDETGRLPH